MSRKNLIAARIRGPSACRIPPDVQGLGMIEVSREAFLRMVEAAWLLVPGDLRSRVENLHIVIEDEPSPEDYVRNGVPEEEDLFGLFEGVALTESMEGTGHQLPNTIRVFQRPHEEVCDTLEELEEEVIRTVHHEVAHHFGIDDGRLEEIGAY